MPLTTIPPGRQPSELRGYITSLARPESPTFLVVYASHVDGRSWCGDCTAAEPLIEKKFTGGGKQVLVAWAGDRAEWRDPENPYRKEPYKVEKLPTLIKITADGKWERLVEEDVYDQKKLDAFVDS